MKFSTSATALALAATTTTTLAQNLNQSAPFHLVLSSANKTIDGQKLAACHSGAAIESLCLASIPSPSSPTPLDPVAFNFNTSDTNITPNTTLGAPGVVTYELQGANFNESEALGLFINPTSNVALPLFYPGDSEYTTMAFDKDDMLNIQGSLDDGVTPPVTGDTKAYYRWYACTTYYSGYVYSTLAWVIGEGKPQNPSCVSVGVKRVFV